MQIGDNAYIAIGLFGACSLILLALLAFWPAMKAHRKGRDFIKWYLFGLFLFPAALIASFLMRDRSGEEQEPEDV